MGRVKAGKGPNRPKPYRKFQTEFSLVITTSAVAVAREIDFRRHGVPDRAKGTHLYIVSRTPRVSFEPGTVNLADGRLRGLLRLQRRDHYDAFAIDSGHQWGQDARWTSQWPHDEFTVKNAEDEEVASGVVAMLGSQATTGSGWPDEATTHEVVYVGQAFGKAGERNAWDRLRSHGTLQRATAETQPDRQVWLSLLDITDMQVITAIGPNPGTVTDIEDDQHIGDVIQAVEQERFEPRATVALAEAGLIRYFQPHYNEQQKHAFPTPDSVPLETARKLDLNALTIELQGQEVGARYGSDTVLPNWLHFADYEIHQDPGRRGLLDLREPDASPLDP